MPTKAQRISALAQSPTFTAMSDVDKMGYLGYAYPELDAEKRLDLIKGAASANSTLGILQNTFVQSGAGGLLDTSESGRNDFMAKAARTVGGAAASVGQFAAGTLAAGGNPLGGVALMGLSAAGNKAREQVDSGEAENMLATDWKRNALAGVAEAGIGAVTAGAGGAALRGLRGGVVAAGRAGLTQGLEREAIKKAMSAAALKKLGIVGGVEALTEGVGEVGVELTDQAYTGNYNTGALVEAGITGAIVGGGMAGVQSGITQYQQVKAKNKQAEVASLKRDLRVMNGEPPITENPDGSYTTGITVEEYTPEAMQQKSMDVLSSLDELTKTQLKDAEKSHNQQYMMAKDAGILDADPATLSPQDLQARQEIQAKQLAFKALEGSQEADALQPIDYQSRADKLANLANDPESFKLVKNSYDTEYKALLTKDNLTETESQNLQVLSQLQQDARALETQQNQAIEATKPEAQPMDVERTKERLTRIMESGSKRVQKANVSTYQKQYNKLLSKDTLTEAEMQRMDGLEQVLAHVDSLEAKQNELKKREAAKRKETTAQANQAIPEVKPQKQATPQDVGQALKAAIETDGSQAGEQRAYEFLASQGYSPKRRAGENGVEYTVNMGQQYGTVTIPEGETVTTTMKRLREKNPKIDPYNVIGGRAAREGTGDALVSEQLTLGATEDVALGDMKAVNDLATKQADNEINAREAEENRFAVEREKFQSGVLNDLDTATTQAELDAATEKAFSADAERLDMDEAFYKEANEKIAKTAELIGEPPPIAKVEKVAKAEEVAKVETLPADASLEAESQKVGAKRVAPDRVSHHAMTPEKGIAKMREEAAGYIDKIKNSPNVKATKSSIESYKKYQKAIEAGEEISANQRKWYEASKKAGMDGVIAKDDATKFLGQKSTVSRKELLEKLERATKDDDYMRGFYKAAVKKDISKGYVFSQEVLSSDPDFLKARTARERYEKGLKTSFSADDSRIVFDDRVVGGLKRQDGKPITKEQVTEIADGVQMTADALGLDINKISEENRWVYVHLNGKNPFLMKNTAGLHRKDTANDSTSISVGGQESIQVTKDGKKENVRLDVAMPHELGHALDSFLDWKLMDSKQLFSIKSVMNYSKGEGSAETKASVAGAKKYWLSNKEVLARAIEQYVLNKNGIASTLEDHAGYWSASEFDSTVAPVVEAAISGKLEKYKYAKEADPVADTVKPDAPKMEAKPDNYARAAWKSVTLDADNNVMLPDQNPAESYSKLGDIKNDARYGGLPDNIKALADKVDAATKAGKQIFGQFYDPKGEVKRAGVEAEMYTPIGFKFVDSRFYEGEAIPATRKPYTSGKNKGLINVGMGSDKIFVDPSDLDARTELHMQGYNDRGEFSTRILSRQQGEITISTESGFTGLYENPYLGVKQFDPAQMLTDVILSPVQRANEANRLGGNASLDAAKSEAVQRGGAMISALGEDVKLPMVVRTLEKLRTKHNEIFQAINEGIGC
jgi:hypothetical protein